MKQIMIAAAAFALAACPGPINNIPTAPAQIADQTKIDEQVGLTVTLAYTAAARAAALAIETGVIKDNATIARIGELNSRAYAAVLAVRAAYSASNASGYASALNRARGAITALLAAAKGN